MARKAPTDQAAPAGTAHFLARTVPIVVLVALLVLVPPIAFALDDPFLIKVFTRVIVFAIAAVALNFILGFGDLVSLVQAGLLGIGAYVVAILAHHDFDGTPFLGLLPGTSNLALSIPLGALASALFALVIGLVCLRTIGVYFIMITLAFNQMLYYFFVALQQYGGEDGLQILGNLHFAGFDVTKRVTFYYICVGILAVVLVLFDRLIDSRLGIVSRALSQNERRVVALGIPPLRYKLVAFVISGALAGVAGTLLAASQQFVSPADISWVRSGDLVVMAVLGGLSTVWGPVAGAAVFLVLELTLSSLTIHWQLIFGLLIIAMIMYLHGGLSDLWSLALGKRGSGSRHD